MSEFTIYGPYTRPNGRRLIIEVDLNGKRRTVSYPKWLLEQQLGRKLDPDQETVDHIDSNLYNNELSNLKIMPRKEHSSEDTRRVKWIDFTCPWCDKAFSRSPRLIRDKAKKNKSGPFCSRSCAGKYSRMLQLKLIDKMAPQQHIVSEYFKRKNVTASYFDDSNDIYIEELLALASMDFIYHETKATHLPSIKEEGLQTTSFGQSLVSSADGRVMSPDEYKEMIISDLVDEEGDLLSEAELMSQAEEYFNQEIPKSDRVPRTYISEKEPGHLSYGEVLLRFPREVAGAISKDVDPFILREVPPEAIEVKINDTWRPLIS